MALVVQLVNVSNLAEVSDYEWQSYVYGGEGRVVLLGSGTVRGHRRSDGWEALVKRLARSLRTSKQVPRGPSQPRRS